MRKQIIVIPAIILCMVSCDNMATLFHGEKPAVTYTVTFDANNASGTPPAVQTVNAGTVINLPGKGGMSKGTDIFAGWDESSSGSGTIYFVGAGITVTRNMTFYAQWLDSTTPQYTVTFNANGATSGASPASQTVYRGISITIPNQGTLAYSGKTFGGWNTQPNGGGTNYVAGAMYTVTGDTTLYAKWQSEVQYTVTFNANGASGTPPTAQTVDPGTVVTLPGAGGMTNSGKTFDGWNTAANGSGIGYAEGEGYTVNGNVSLYARWIVDSGAPLGENPPGSTLSEKLAYIRNNAGDGIVYDIVVDTVMSGNTLTIGTETVATMGRDITVIIRSASPVDVKTIQLDGQGHVFSVDANITLKLQDIVLRGHSNNNRALVGVGSGGTLILNSGSKISANTNTSTQQGGGIYVNGSNLEINDGAEIIGNTITISNSIGGGIHVANRGSVTILGGLISENKSTGGTFRNGGGIGITGNSSVTMRGGIISKNSAAGGGGVEIVDSGSSFIKRAAPDSIISGIIYGGICDNANISTYNAGHAIRRNFGTKLYRNTTLGGYDEISTGNDEGWE